MKICLMCNEGKVLSDFHKDKNRKDGLYVYCKSCVKCYQNTGLRLVGGKEYRKKHYAENRDRFRAEMKARMRMKLYGVSEESFAAMLDAQQHKCAICSEDLKKPHVDHDHETGHVRGLLCGQCNVGIGMLRDSPELLRAALAYLIESAKKREAA